jgi:hypothetical protein
MSPRDIRALKLVLVIVLTVATMVLVSADVTHQVRKDDAQMERLDHAGECPPEPTSEEC